MGRFALTVSSLALLATGGFAMMQMMAGAPAFNAEQRRGNVFDQNVLMLGREMYDPARYLMQQAVSFIRADLVPVEGFSYGENVASIDDVMARGAEAVTLARDSLRHNPGNAQGWAVLSWAELYAGNPEQAIAALRQSWALAPYNASLCRERVDLAVTLFDPTLNDDADAAVPMLTETDRAAILRDMATIQRNFGANTHALYAVDLVLLDIDPTRPAEG